MCACMFVILTAAACTQPSGTPTPTPPPPPACSPEMIAYIETIQGVLVDLAERYKGLPITGNKMRLDIDRGTPPAAVIAAYRDEFSRQTAAFGTAATRIRAITPPDRALEIHAAYLELAHDFEAVGKLYQEGFEGGGESWALARKTALGFAFPKVDGLVKYCDDLGYGAPRPAVPAPSYSLNQTQTDAATASGRVDG